MTCATYTQTIIFSFSIEAENEEDKKTETKFNRIASINFPNLSGIFNKFRRNTRSDDIELGSGPGGKAGLASMETLDDSTKDPWNQENGGDAVDAEKTDEPKIVEEPVQEKRLAALIESVQSYKCSIGESWVA